MTTQVIGIKEFRQNITHLWKEAREKNIRYIVMYHSQPIMEITPLHQDYLVLEELASDIYKARKQVKKREVYSETEVYRKLGL